MLHFNRSTEVLGEVIAVHDGLHVGSHKRYKIKHVGVVVLIMCYVLLESYVTLKASLSLNSRGKASYNTCQNKGWIPFLGRISITYSPTQG